MPTAARRVQAGCNVFTPAPATVPLAAYMRACGPKKKAFDVSAMRCTFCKKKGHERYFCPLAPTVPEHAERRHFADVLINTPAVRHEVKDFADTDGAALYRLMTEGARLNEGNPWAGSTKPLL